MKHIAKRNAPAELERWKRENAGLNDDYDSMPADVRQAVKARLLDEQGGLCCYSGQRIDLDNCHIEHLKSQRQCREEGRGEDVAYENLLAAYPSDRAPVRCAYGAHPKADQVLPVSPLRADCESRLRYDRRGRVAPTNEADSEASDAIGVLCLNDDDLKSRRARVIDEALYRRETSKAQARRLMQAMAERDANNQFRPFCFVIQQACAAYVQQIERRRAAKRGMRAAQSR